MKCPDCNAHNAEGATFCTLCMRSFVQAPPPVELPDQPTPPRDPVAPAPAPPPVPISPPSPVGPADAPGPAAAPGPAEGPGPADGTSGDAAATPPVGPGGKTARAGRFRKTEEGFDWQCDRCASWNPLEITTCHVCARPFRQAMGEEDEAAIPADADPTIATILSAVAPGSGHLLLDRPGTGWARLVLFGIWVLGAISLAGQASAAGQTPWVAVPLLGGALVLSVISVLDVQRIFAGRSDTVLGSSGFFYLVVGVFGLTIISMVPNLLSATGNGLPAQDVPVDVTPVDPSTDTGEVPAGDVGGEPSAEPTTAPT